MAIPVCEKWLTLQRATCPRFAKLGRVRVTSTTSRRRELHGTFPRRARIFLSTTRSNAHGYLIIDALRNRIESGPVRCYYGDWIVVYRGREIARWDHHLNVLVVRRCTRPDRMYQCYMNGFFKAFRVPVRVRYHSGFHLQTKAGSVADLQTERIIRL